VISTTVVVVESFAACIFSLLCWLIVEECKDLAMILWCIWRRHNDKVWDGEMKLSNISYQLARKLLFQWQAARNSTTTQSQQSPQDTVMWQPLA
jgi:hypothetical protein